MNYLSKILLTLITLLSSLSQVNAAGASDVPLLAAKLENKKSTIKENEAVKVNIETATFAGGCFWGMEELMRKIPGVKSTRVGYTGGKFDNPTYNDVKGGKTGHAEAIEVLFDPTVLSYAELLEDFFRIHDPTTLNRQGNDSGTQYRSAIFYHSDAQHRTAEQVKAKIEGTKKWSSPIVTEILPVGQFYTAEEYHQKYLEKHPDGYTCHFWRP